MDCLLLISLDGSYGDWSGWSVCSQSCGDLLLIYLDGSLGDWNGWSVCC
jgi:hypothetical protein